MKEHEIKWLERNGYKNEQGELTWSKVTTIGTMRCNRSGQKPVITLRKDDGDTFTMTLTAESRHKRWIELTVSDIPDLVRGGFDTEMRLVGAWREFC